MWLDLQCRIRFQPVFWINKQDACTTLGKSNRLITNNQLRFQSIVIDIRIQVKRKCFPFWKITRRWRYESKNYSRLSQSFVYPLFLGTALLRCCSGTLLKILSVCFKLPEHHYQWQFMKIREECIDFHIVAGNWLKLFQGRRLAGFMSGMCFLYNPAFFSNSEVFELPPMTTLLCVTTKRLS